jgi:hypothetical protein
MKIIQDAAGKTIFAGYALPSPAPVGTVLTVPDTDPRCTMVFTLPLAMQAQAVLNKKTQERIQRAVTAGRTTWATADVIAYCAYLDKCQAIVSGIDLISTVLPTAAPYPVGT